jgi:Gpi18-like mannosyltransferase
MFDRRIARGAIVAFVASRVLTFALLIAGSQIAFLGKVYSNTIWETRVVLQSERLRPELERLVMVGDAWWYRSIALRGYDRPPVSGRTPNWAFFPLYPVVVRTLSITGSFALDGMLVSNGAFLAALLLLGTAATRFGLTTDDAERAMFYLAFFPTSYFLSLPMTESLFLALSLGSILAAREAHWPLAGILGGLAALTRFPGILLVVPLALLARERWTSNAAWRAAWIALVPAGTGAYMAYLARTTGDPLAFAHVQQHWNRAATWFWRPLAAFAAKPQAVGEPWNLLVLNFAVAVLLLAAGIILLARRQWALGAYTLASALLPLSTGSLQSIARYGLVVFPLFLVLAIAGRRSLVDRVVLATNVLILGWLIAMMTLRVDFALA